MNMRRIVCPALWAAVVWVPFGVAAALPAGEPVSTAAPSLAPELVPVTVEAPVVRRDVRTACPAIDGALQKMLGPAWGRLGQTGSTQVRFSVENQRVTRITSSGSLSDYLSYIRKAVSKLDCQTASSGPQEFRFLLVIRDPDDTPSSPERVALISVD